MTKRYIIEFGSGIDFHGQDYTGAAKKAVKDAISHSCLCGLSEILGITDFNRMLVNVTIAVPKPEMIKRNDVLKEIPFGNKKLTVVKGGMQVPGLYIPELGDSDNSIVVANACVEVRIPL